MQRNIRTVTVVLAAVSAVCTACNKAQTSPSLPNPLATTRLAPVSAVATGSLDPARVLDRDTTTSVPIAAPASITLRFAHAIEVRRVKAYGAGVRISGPGVELDAGQGAWVTAAPAAPFSTDAITLEIEPREPGAHLEELEVWGAGLPVAPRNAQALALALATLDAKSSPFENVIMIRADNMPATLAPAGLDDGADCVRSPLRTPAPLRQVRRAYLAYEANVQRPAVLKRSLDAAAPVGGFWLAATQQVRTIADEIDPERLTGDDSVLLCLPEDATGKVTVSGLRLLLVADDGRDLFDRETRLAWPEATDGDGGTGTLVHATRIEAGFDRAVGLDEAEVVLAATPAGLTAFGSFDGQAWAEQGPLALGALHTPLPLEGAVAQAVEMTFAGSARADVPAANVAELAFTASGVGQRVATPRIVLTSPALRIESGRWIGERFDGRTYVAGWAESPAGPGVVTVDGIDAGIDGAFGLAATRPQAATGAWDVIVRAHFPGGADLVRTLHLEDDRQSEILQDGVGDVSSLPSDLRFGRENQTAWGTADGTSGGRVVLGTEASIDIPPGAVSSKTSIGITRKGPEVIPQLDAGMINVTAPANSAYRFLPKGQKFAVPARVTLPYDSDLLPEGVLPEEVRTYYFDEAQEKWIALPRREVNRSTKRVVSETTHFTFMINAVLVLPDHPGPTSFNPNSIKDLKAADPSAGIDLVQPPDANSQGSAQLVHPIRLPKARGAYQPDLRLSYDSSAGNGWVGVGWELPVSSVQLDTRWGVPDPILGEPRYLLDGAQLVPTGDTAVCEGTAAPGALFRERVEREFKRIVRCGTYPNTWFEVADRSGTLFVYGFADSARLRNPRWDGFAIGQWFLERVVDLNGNLTEYGYDLDMTTPADLSVNGEPFHQVYLRSIRYTGRASRTGSEAVAGGTPGPYVVDLYAATKGGAIGGPIAVRPDVLVSGRLGFKVLTRRLLGRVRVSLDPGSTVAGQSAPAAQPIREYVLDYGTSSLGKSRLARVVTNGFDASGSPAFFYEHGFEYEDPDLSQPFGQETVPWTFAPAAPDDEQLIRTQDKSKTKSGGLSFGIGIVSVGATASKTNSTTTAHTQLFDVNGDGLPDRVFLSSDGGPSTAQFNGGLSEASSQLQGSFRTTLPAGDPAAGMDPGQIPLDLGGGYGWSKVKAGSAGVFGISAKMGNASSTSISSGWAADVDGDGYPDMVTPNGVLFGQPRTAVSPGFAFAPWKLDNSLDLPAGLPSGVEDGRRPSDAVLEWIAPFAGNVDVTASFALVDMVRPPTDPAWDGVRLRIFRADDTSPGFTVTQLYETKTDETKVGHPEAIALNAVSVASGTRLYFVLSTLANFPVDFSTSSPIEETQFAPVVVYRGASQPQKTALDPSGAPSHLFDSAADFRVASGTPVAFTPPVGGTVHLSTTVVKQPSGDDVRVCVQKFPAGWAGLDHPCNGTGFVLVAQRSYDSTATIADSLNLDVQVEPGVQLVFRVESDLAIDPAALEWRIAGSMTQVCDEQGTCASPPASVAELLSFFADPFFPPHLAVEPGSISGGPYSANPSGSPLTPFVVSAQGKLEIVTRQAGSWSAPSGTFISARTRNGLVFKRNPSDPPTTITIDVVAGQEIYFEGHGDTQVPAGWSPAVTFINAGGIRTSKTVPVNQTQDAFLDTNGRRWQLRSGYGGGYHGWSRGAWHGRGSDPFDPATFLVLLPYLVEQRFPDLAAKLDDPQSAESLALAANSALYPRRLGTRGGVNDPGLKPDVKAFVSLDRNTFMTATTLHASIEEVVAGVQAVPVFPGAVFSRRSDTKGKQIGLDVLGIAGLDQSEGSSWQSKDAVDMNGDRVIDRVSRVDCDGCGATVQLTSINGAPAPTYFYNGDLLQRSTDKGASAYLGDHVGLPKIGAGSPVIQAIVGNASTSAGVSVGVNLSSMDNELVDINGDGLPDRVSMPFPGVLMVQLNLGGKFGAPDYMPVSTWSAGDIDKLSRVLGNTDPVTLSPNRVRRSVAATIQSSVGASLIVGVGRSWESSLASTEVEFVDVTGDGLPDYVRKGPSDDVLYVMVNTGDGFLKEQAWPLPAWNPLVTLPFLSGQGLFGGAVNDLLDAVTGPRTFDVVEANGSYTKEPSKSWSISAGGSIGIISFGGSYSEQKSTRETGLQLGMIDIDGDGFADHVLKAEQRDDGTSNAEVIVRLNRLGEANLLKHVKRPLGGAIDLFYARAGHTVSMPEHRWVLSQVVARDGRGSQARDLVVVGHDLQTLYAYTEGHYDRNEREFLGFASVDRTNGDGSHVIRGYRNDRFAFKGLPTGERVVDSQGRTLVETLDDYADPYSDPTYRFQSGEPSCDLRRPFAYGPGDFWCGSLFPALVKVQKKFYEGEAAARLVTRQELHYDGFGNVDHFDDFGDASPQNTADDVHATVTYWSDSLATAMNSVSRAHTLEVRDANGAYLRWREGEYDTRGNLHRLISHVDAKTTVDSFLDWDDLGRLHQARGPDVGGNTRYTVTYDYDPVVHSFVTSTTDSHGYSSSAGWDYGFGEVASTTDINGNVTRRVLDAFGRVKDVYGPYDTAAPTAHVDFGLSESAPYAITRNRLPEGGTLDTVTLIDGLGRVIQTKKTALVYGRGLGWSVTGQQLFDAMGRVAVQGQTFFELGSSPLYRDGTPSYPRYTAYDALGRTVQSIEPIEPTGDHTDGRAVTTMAYGFGTAGRGFTRLSATVTDPQGKVRVMYRDPGDRVVAVDERNAGVVATTHYDYDPLGEILQVTDARGNMTSLGYDWLGRRTSLQNPEAGTTAFHYDAAGNLTQKTDSRKITIQYFYDFDQLRRIEYPDSAAVTYDYGPPGAPENGAGRVVAVGDDAGTEARGYGKLGELVRTTRTIPALRPGDVEKTFETKFAFDSYGRMQWITYPDGEKVTYGYDPGGLLKSAVGARPATKFYAAAQETYLASLAYDEHGQRRYMTLGNGAFTQYDYYLESLRLKALHTEAAGQTLQALSYRYDRVGNVLGLTNSLPPPTTMRSGPVSFEYAYDDLYRLTSATGTAQSRSAVVDSFQATYGYDAIHNMNRNTQVHVIHTLGDPGDGTGTPAKTNHDFGYEYDPQHPHQAIRIGETNIQYDEVGNTKVECRAPNATASAGCGSSGDGLRRFYWTDENRLSAVIDGGGQNATRFIYDAAGERVVKMGRGGESLTIGQFFSLKGRRAATKHVFAGATRLASKLLPPPGWQPATTAIVLASTTTSTSTIPGCDPSSYNPQKCPVLPGGDPVLNHQTDGTVVRPETYYYHSDHLGSTSWVTDQNGRVHEHVEYFPYGEVWRDVHGDTQGGPVKGQRFLFTGKEMDEETGLYYFGARYYDPVHVRWVNCDPILADALVNESRARKPNKLSVYAYASFNPVMRIDPDGADDVVFYYTGDKDGAFGKAARTYMAELRESGRSQGRLIPIPVASETEFKIEWGKLRAGNIDVTSMAIFSHGGVSRGEGALYFHPDVANDGTLSASEISALPSLTFSSGATIDIHACNSANGDASAAQAFADSQGVVAIGRTGFSYFSQQRDRYVETKDSVRRIYLDAFAHGKNKFLGSGDLMSPKVVPPTVPPTTAR